MGNTVETFTAQVYMAGDIETAKGIIRKTCYEEGLCVTVTPTTFIYTGGEESGFVVGFVNYPRFPTTGKELVQRALNLMQKLIPALNQKSALLVASDFTSWMTIDPPGARVATNKTALEALKDRFDNGDNVDKKPTVQELVDKAAHESGGTSTAKE